MSPRWSNHLAATAALPLLASSAAACGVPATTAPEEAPPSSATPPPSDTYDQLVLEAGQRVEASGRVVSVPRRPTRFCAPVAEAAIGYAEGREPAPTYCEQGIDVAGVNLSTLTNRRQKDGAVEGSAALDLVYRGHGSASVVHQAPDRDPEKSLDPSDRVPCPPPDGGWPVGAKDDNLDLTALQKYTDTHPGDVLTLAMLRPSSTQVIAYVLTLTDPAPVAAALRPAYGKPLCVVRSRYTQAQITRAADAFTPLMQHGPVYVVSAGGLGPDAQPVVGVELTAVTTKTAALAGRQARGLVRLRPWLAPSR